MLKIVDIRTMNMINPIGITKTNPRLSWKIESDKDSTMQVSYRIIIDEDPENVKNGKGRFYDSDVVESDSTRVRIPRPVYESVKRYYWAVESTDNHGDHSGFSEVQFFETGLMRASDWKAKWIEPPQRPYHPYMPGDLMELVSTPVVHKEVNEAEFEPCPIIRKEIVLKDKPVCARLYATARGVYQASINGTRVGNLEFMPEATPYKTMLQVQTYDVTEMLNTGANVVGMTLGDGWWRGAISCLCNTCVYGTTVAGLWQLAVIYDDGTTEIFGSDEECTSYTGAIRWSDLGVGEKIDRRMEVEGWDCPGEQKGAWFPVEIKDYGYDNLVGQNAEPVKVVATLSPVSTKEYDDGTLLIDFGQVIAGNAKIVFDGTGRRGEKIRLSYCEQVDKNGDFIYNFAAKKQHEDFFILAGEEQEIYEPKFSYRGFRWLRVMGYSGKINLEKVEARLIASDLPRTGKLVTSDPKITKLNENIYWTMINNVLSIPTDNPDRERGGWTGDFEMISATMFYHIGAEQFSTRWFEENRMEQLEDGCIPVVIPNHVLNLQRGAAGWGDEVVIAPWEAYQAYGDKQILTDNYEMMQRWVDYFVRRMQFEPPLHFEPGNAITGTVNLDMSLFKNWGPDMSEETQENFRYIWDADFQNGDWMTPSGNIGDDGEWTYVSRHNNETFTVNYYTAYTTELMTKIAEALGKKEDADYYRSLNKNIRKAVIAEMYDTGYIPENEFQGVLTLALKAGLYPEGERKVLEERLVNVIKNKDEGKINTGFTSMEHIMFELVKAGYTDVAYDLLFNEKIPSFLYMIDRDATCMWETWRNISEDGTVNTASYSQYGIANIGRWLMGGIGGITPATPGYKKIRIAPAIDPKRRITGAKVRYMTPHGEVRSEWTVDENIVKLDVCIPANTTAVIFLPGSDEAAVEVGSGKYSYSYELK